MNGARARTTRMIPRGAPTVWEIVTTIEGEAGLRARVFAKPTGEHRVDVELKDERGRTSKVHEESADGPDARARLELLARTWMDGFVAGALTAHGVRRRR
jgi:hypothetical protein